ncbi:acetyl-CoA hydrolase/transferase family protein [Thermodesulfobacteriota bacterium]
MADWRRYCEGKLVSAEEAVKCVKSGDRVAISINFQPTVLINALAERRNELNDVTIASDALSDLPWLRPGWENNFQLQDMFGVRFSRQGLAERRIDYVPYAFGLCARDGCLTKDADVFMMRVSPPNSRGYCSFGHSVYINPISASTAKTVIAEVDPGYARTYPERIHVSDIDFLVEIPPLYDAYSPKSEEERHLPLPPTDEWEKASVIGSFASTFVNDGDTVEVGTGTASEAVLEFLDTRNDLGIDSEMIYSKNLELIKAGVITGKNKNRNKGKAVAAGVFLYVDAPDTPDNIRYVDHNPIFQIRDLSYICNVRRIAQNNNQVAINSILGLDLMGQVITDHLGSIPIGGIGGGLEYNIAAHYSRGGKAIMTLISTAKGGTVSRIIPQFEKGTVIGGHCAYTGWLITEHGMVNLEGKSVRQRADAIISVAHPDYRSELRKAAKKLFYP